MNSFVRDGVVYYCSVRLAWVGIYSVDVSRQRLASAGQWEPVLSVGMSLIPDIEEPNLDSTGVNTIAIGYTYSSVVWSPISRF